VTRPTTLGFYPVGWLGCADAEGRKNDDGKMGRIWGGEEN